MSIFAQGHSPHTTQNMQNSGKAGSMSGYHLPSVHAEQAEFRADNSGYYFAHNAIFCEIYHVFKVYMDFLFDTFWQIPTLLQMLCHDDFYAYSNEESFCTVQARLVTILPLMLLRAAEQ